MYQLTNLYLENGLKVVLHKIPKSKTVACGVWVKQGSRYEDDSTSGLSHLLEHLVITSNNNDNDLLDKVEEKGIVYNATTTKEFTYYYLSGVTDTLEFSIETLANLLTTYKPVSSSAFDNEKKIVLREASGFYSSFKQIAERSGQALWGKSDVGRIIVGDIEVLKNARQESIEELYRNSYTPENATVVVVGDFDNEQIVSVIQKYFSSWEDRKTIQTKFPVSKDPGIYINNQSGGENALLSLCFKLPQFTSSYRNTIEVISLILGDGGIKSRLAKEIRMKRGLAYIINSFESFYKDRGLLGFATVCAPNTTDEIVQIMMDEFNRCKSDGFTETEIVAAKNKLVTKRLLGLENVQDHLKFLGKCSSYDNIFSIEQEIRNIKKVDDESINEVLEMIFNDSNMGLAAIGDINIDAILEKINFR